MLTILKKIFIWWNQDTFGTRLKTIFFGKLVGIDELGNKYYQSKKGKRWVVYADTIDASKIPVEWYSWIHFTPNKIEKKHILEKYEWQKPHQSNLTGTDQAYYPNKNKDEVKKNIKVGKNSFKLKLIIFLYFSLSPLAFSQSNLEGTYTNIKILDKISTKNTLLKLKNGDLVLFKDLSIKSVKCKNSEFDDNPEITPYMQVTDLNNLNNDEVFVFNGWMFSSSPSITPFDHPVYDIWLVNCY